MNYPAARTSLSIRIVTGLVLALTAGFCVASWFDRPLLIASLGLGVVVLLCYLSAPVAYEVTEGRFTVRLRAGRKCFGELRACHRLTSRIPFTIRLFGNGGVFAGTGLYWNRPYGVFRAYATSARTADAVLVETARGRVLITPADPTAFVATCGA